jgi:hypothetical protein
VFGDHTRFSKAATGGSISYIQGAGDNVGTITARTLLLGPEDSRYLHHNLVHVYSEWLLDQLIGNAKDVLPAETWLYDGIGEFEALRYAPAHLPCASPGNPPFDVTRIDSARRWLRLRASPMGAEEYCLAALEVRRIVATMGWPALLRLLQKDGIERAGRLLAGRFPPAG